jgi:6,7-dimethyl-8-ribityllumazine synthase
MISEERMMVVEAVFNGQLGEEHLSQEEIDVFFEMVCDAATEALMVEAVERGCSVFDGIVGDTIQ